MGYRGSREHDRIGKTEPQESKRLRSDRAMRAIRKELIALAGRLRLLGCRRKKKTGDAFLSEALLLAAVAGLLSTRTAEAQALSRETLLQLVADMSRANIPRRPSV